MTIPSTFRTTMSAAEKLALTADDYLAWEAEQLTKHEFVAGEVFAMAGASDAHVTIRGNVFAELRQQLRGTPCRVYIADMKLRVERADAFFLLSPSTSAYDRGLKFAFYRQLPSLREYLLIDTERVAIELYRREGKDWRYWPLTGGETIELASIGLQLPVDMLYEDAWPANSLAGSGEVR